MPRYILLVDATRQGVENRKSSPARIEKHKNTLKAAGIDVRASYHTLGPHDGLMIVDAPNGAAVGRPSTVLKRLATSESKCAAFTQKTSTRRWLRLFLDC
jgi:uncharacterized protein with GYD domain